MPSTGSEPTDPGGEAATELRARAARARRLAREVGDDAAAESLRLLANELETKAVQVEGEQRRAD